MVEQWRKAKPLTISQLRHYWNKVEESLPMIDTARTEYKEFTDDSCSKSAKGMANLKSNFQTGVTNDYYFDNPELF